MFWFADAKADADGEIGLAAEPADVLHEIWWQFGPFARDTSYGDLVKEAGGRFGDAQCAVARRGRRDELDEAEAASCTDFSQSGRFFDRQVWHNQPSDALFLHIVCVAL